MDSQDTLCASLWQSSHTRPSWTDVYRSAYGPPGQQHTFWKNVVRPNLPAGFPNLAHSPFARIKTARTPDVVVNHSQWDSAFEEARRSAERGCSSSDNSGRRGRDDECAYENECEHDNLRSGSGGRARRNEPGVNSIRVGNGDRIFC